MVSVAMGGSPAVGPRVGLVPATDVLCFDGNPPGGACGRVSRRACKERKEANNIHIDMYCTRDDRRSPRQLAFLDKSNGP